MDWSARLRGRSPALDPLAALIPADQHAVFLPGLPAAAAVLAQARGDAVPVLGLLGTSPEDGHVLRRYERQLGVAFADLAGFPGRDAVKGLALTGSDPYLPSGTDLAVLFETDAPGDLAAFLKAHGDEARRAAPDSEEAGGEIDGVRYSGARTPDRSLSTYVAALDRAVVLANSRAQLARLVDAAHGKTPVLAGLPEYRFFRDRYARGEGGESAFLVLSDATIRRWCGPRWRIGSSRRVRAGAALAAIQVEYLPRIIDGATGGVRPGARPGSIDLGPLHLGRSGVRSEIYGTLDFPTPIVELALAEADRGEADAYARWRDTYQQNWRGVFDPIAARLAAGPGRLSADLTVMPLIANTDYRPFLELAGSARIAPGAGDRHPGSLAHAALALDARSGLLRQGGDLISNLARVPRQVALGWLGGSASLYLDDDPFWADLAAAAEPEEFLSSRFNRLPVALRVEVVDGARLALFLAGLRAYVDQSAPNLTTWEDREHRGQRYVRVAEAGDPRPDGVPPPLALYYYASPRALTLSPREEVVKRAIDRLAGTAEAGPKPGPWLGESLAFEVSRRGVEVLGGAAWSEYREALRLRSWGNLPILNEWKRLYPDRDPVAVHEQVWGTTPVDPGGGRYAWNPRWATMESTVFGHPGEPKDGREAEGPAGRIASMGLGLDFEGGGLRARTEVELRPGP